MFILSVIPIKSASQNTIEKKISVGNISNIILNGDQIFNITVSTTNYRYIKITSTLDGEYQNQFQIVTNQNKSTLNIGLKRLPFSEKVDDKRNAHKVVAATLHIAIPEFLSLNINSDIGSVDVSGKFERLSIELLRGYFNINGFAKNVIVNTIDGNIKCKTKKAKVIANSKNGSVTIANFGSSKYLWKLNSINGNISVEKAH